MKERKFIEALGFQPKENVQDIFHKKYAVSGNYSIEVNFDKKLINYGKKIKWDVKTTQNFSQAENWVILECVNRLLEKGYKPENIFLEKVWRTGHGTSGRLDILVTRDDGTAYLMIECKNHGADFIKEFKNIEKNGGQLFTYFQQERSAEILMLYASHLDNKNQIQYRNEIVKIEDDYRQTNNVKDFYDRWNKIPKSNGVFEDWVNSYHFESKALTPKSLKEIKQEDSSFIFNRFLEILRHNVVSDKPNAFNKIFTLFLCKVYDEKTTKLNEELKFQWLEGKDDEVSFQIRLADLYKNGMLEFLEKEVSDFSESEFDQRFASLFAGNESLKQELKYEIIKLRLEKNNEFAIKEVFDRQSFVENSKIVKEVVELLQGYRIRYNKRQQYLSDFFELLLTTGLKQESGQFFTPVPIAQFIIKSLPLDDMVNQKLSKGVKNDLLPYIIDYAAGSGHFLTESMHEIQRLLDAQKPKDYIADTAKKITNWQDDHFDWATQYVYGIEKDYRLVKVGKVGCYLHGDGLANVILSDGLANFSTTKEYKGLLKKSDPQFPKENKQFDVVISNPPYSVSSFKNSAREYYTENDFELYEKLTDNSSEIECLFIERTKQLLKDGGIVGIILPSSILNNAGIYTKAREIILQYFELIAIAELGSNTFMATGTNTVTLFLRRRNNYDSINLKIAINKFFTDLQDVTLNGVEKPVSKYVKHVWEGCSFADYKTLLGKQPNAVISANEIYVEYRKKIKAKTETEFWNVVVEKENDKLLHFILTYPQQTLLIKSGQKDEEKRFLGYEFSFRRGSEGIHPVQRNKSIDECTKLYDADVFDNPEKASTYIYKAFKGEKLAIHASLQKNISRHNLVDMLTFDGVDFEKNISTSIKKKVEFGKLWNTDKIIPIIDVADIQKGSSITKEKTIAGNYPVVAGGKEPAYYHNKYNRKNPVITVSASGAYAGFVNYFDEPIFASDCNTIKSKDETVVITKLIYYFLKTIQKEIFELQKGQAQPHVYAGDLSKIKIPLLPLDVQRRIISKMDILEKEQQKIQGNIASLQNEIASFTSKTVGEATKLQDITSKIGSGATPLGGEGVYKAEGITFIRSQNVYDGFFTDEGLAYIDDEQAEKLDNVSVEENDLLFNITGASIARCCIVENKYLPARVNQHVAIIRANEKVLPKYLQVILCSIEYKNRLLDIGEGATSRQAITKAQLENFKIPLPSITEQKKIVAAVEKIEAKIAVLEKQQIDIDKQKEMALNKYL
ncbi:restriction endonuclease subunit S [Chitinophaga alhagiae]|uniref:Restriction endonuclease subunit S n=1 Tax=Chitinophaga alhagiae TaxID=2203219 RepID=A0ABM6W817_9BACT|nr:restriction endonuclease subunit S [Chitinophaga alhagiae]AWO00210.1 restriction endonuclease subunit S [Chitinophaga alhagiae]